MALLLQSSRCIKTEEVLQELMDESHTDTLRRGIVKSDAEMVI